jgi:thiol-disulfide isomerase/thioredoxin
VTAAGFAGRAAALLLALVACGCAASPGAAPSAAGGGTSDATPAVAAASPVAGSHAAGSPVAGSPAAAARNAADPYAALVAEDPHGRPIPFTEFAGKVRVIDLWASWCGPCRMTIPELNTLYDQYRDKGLVVVGLSVDDNPADVLDFQRNVPMRYPSGMFNRGLAARIGEPSSIPTTLLIDRKGVLRRTFVGYVDVGTLEPLVRALL